MHQVRTSSSVGWLVALLFVIATAPLSCEDSSTSDLTPDDTDPGGDTDADTDADTDGDADSDTDGDGDGDGDTDTDSDGDTDSDSDADADGGADGDTDSDVDTDDFCIDEDEDWWCVEFDCNDTDSSIHPDNPEDTDNGIDDDCDGLTDEDETVDIDTDTGPIEQDCSACDGIGSTLENMRCAIDLCDDDIFISQTYTSPTSSPISTTYAAVAHFGDTTNDLIPRLNDSYALMASGPATGTSHTTSLGGTETPDPYVSGGEDMNDAMEWKLTLTAPEGAGGFEVNYVFFSEEYDEYIGSSFNDKFYIILEAASTNGGDPTIINYTDCRDPLDYYDFEAPECDLPSGYCCYVAINTALSECCWYDSCSTCSTNTDISGTGFSCGDPVGCTYVDSSSYGSSTGWLVTGWPIDEGETFDITFHIHDASDGILDSEVILDSFVFMGSVVVGTHPDK